MVVGLLVLTVAGTVVTEFYASRNFRAVEASWRQMVQEDEVRVRLLGRIKSELGYGGFIHDFKNSVLRTAGAPKAEARAKFNQILTLLSTYRSLRLSPAEIEAADILRSTVREYAARLPIIVDMQAAGASPEEIDAKVKVDDGPALAALNQLSAIAARSFQRSQGSLKRALESGEHLVKFDYILMSIPIFVLIITLIFVKTLMAEIQARTKAEIVAAEANKAKSQFLATMSHEIRTPMTAVLGFSEILLDSYLAPQTERIVAKIKDATGSLLTIINDILDVSALEAGKLVLDYVDVDVPGMVDAVMEMFEVEKSGKRRTDLEMSVVYSPGFPQTAQLDPTRIRQVLFNLIGNAVKFTERGFVKVTCSLQELSEGRQVLRFEISDSGIGIESDIAENVFKEFTQADSSIYRRFEGTGLGLAISKNLVEAHGGQIGFESQAGVGTTFRFQLPFIAPAENSHFAESKPAARVQKPQANRALSVLLVEDVELSREVLSAIVGSLGHEVDVAEDGYEAIEMHESNDYDVILMDARMPELSGPDATRAIRKLGGAKASVPIVAVTADATADQKEEALAAGMNAFVAKPVTMADLAAAIDEAIGETIHGEAPVGPASDGPAALNPGRGRSAEAAGFDPAGAAEKIGLPQEAFVDLIVKFAEGYENAVEEIRTELQTDREAALQSAHSLKGLAATLRFDAIASVAAELQDAIASDDDGDLDRTLGNLQSELTPVIGSIRRFLAKRAAQPSSLVSR